MDVASLASAMAGAQMGRTQMAMAAKMNVVVRERWATSAGDSSGNNLLPNALRLRCMDLAAWLTPLITLSVICDTAEGPAG